MSDKELFVCCYPEYQEKRESTTFWDDFTIADAFGDKAIKDTFNRAFKEWKENYKYLTELVAVLNHKCWMWNGKNDARMELYRSLYNKANNWGLNHLKGEEFSFFYYVLD